MKNLKQYIELCFKYKRKINLDSFNKDDDFGALKPLSGLAPTSNGLSGNRQGTTNNPSFYGTGKKGFNAPAGAIATKGEHKGEHIGGQWVGSEEDYVIDPNYGKEDKKSKSKSEEENEEDISGDENIGKIIRRDAIKVEKIFNDFDVSSASDTELKDMKEFALNILEKYKSNKGLEDLTNEEFAKLTMLKMRMTSVLKKVDAEIEKRTGVHEFSLSEIKSEVNDIIDIDDFKKIIDKCRTCKTKFPKEFLNVAIEKSVSNNNIPDFFDILNKNKDIIQLNDDDINDVILYLGKASIWNFDDCNDFVKKIRESGYDIPEETVYEIFKSLYRPLKDDGIIMFSKFCTENNLKFPEESIAVNIEDTIVHDISSQDKLGQFLKSISELKLSNNIIQKIYNSIKKRPLSFPDRDVLFDRYILKSTPNHNFDELGKIEVEDLDHIYEFDSSFEKEKISDLSEFSEFSYSRSTRDVIIRGKPYLFFNGKLISLYNDDSTGNIKILILDKKSKSFFDSDTGEIIFEEDEPIYNYEHPVDMEEKIHVSEVSKFAALSLSFKNGDIPEVIKFKDNNDVFGNIKGIIEKYDIKNGKLFLNSAIIKVKGGEIESIKNIHELSEDMKQNRDILAYCSKKRNELNGFNKVFDDSDYEGAELYSEDRIKEAFMFMMRNASYYTTSNPEGYKYLEYTIGSGPYNQPLRMFSFGLNLPNNFKIYDSYKMIEEMDKDEGLKEPIIVKRSCSIDDIMRIAGYSHYENEDIESLLKRKGVVLSEDAFMSCGISEGKELRGRNTNLEILLPRGTKGMFLDPVSDFETSEKVKEFCVKYQEWLKKKNAGEEEGSEPTMEGIKSSEISSECEYLLQAGSKFVIEGIEKTKEFGEEIYNIKLRLVEQEPVGFCERLAKWISDTYDIDVDIDKMKEGFTRSWS